MKIALCFWSEESAAHPVAAVPSVARAVRECAAADVRSCVIVTPLLWAVPEGIAAKIERLAPGYPITFTNAANVPPDCIAISGEAIVAADVVAALHRGDEPGAEAAVWPSNSAHEADAMLRRREREIIMASGKPGDGIVSRWLNRPVSRTITRALLSMGPVPPVVATFGTAAISIAMFCALVGLPGYQGQIWGALLFHAASVFDGVDGEIARITFRSSRLGATIDSLVDLATNIAFFLGLISNFHQIGEWKVALVALVGLSFLSIGKLLLGCFAVANREPVTFNVVKDHFARRRNGLKTVLTYLTMRDFYALAAVVLIAAGLGKAGIYMFTTIVAGWLIAVTVTLWKMQAKMGAAWLAVGQMTGQETCAIDPLPTSQLSADASNLH